MSGSSGELKSTRDHLGQKLPGGLNLSWKSSCFYAEVSQRASVTVMARVSHLCCDLPRCLSADPCSVTGLLILHNPDPWGQRIKSNLLPALLCVTTVSHTPSGVFPAGAFPLRMLQQECNTTAPCCLP